ncbi:MAG: GNAT family N-acetyltransferase [Candidatus Ventricola sp.]
MITLRYIGKSADDLRFFILLDGRHAGGITVHSVRPPEFSYGIAVAPALRRRGVARQALALLFARMRAQGFTRAVVRVAPGNAASLALHASLGFAQAGAEGGAFLLAREL